MRYVKVRSYLLLPILIPRQAVFVSKTPKIQPDNMSYFRYVYRIKLLLRSVDSSEENKHLACI